MNPNGIMAYENGQPVKIRGARAGRVTAFSYITALATVGAGTLLAALLIPGCLLRRTGPTGAYTDTTDTAANLTAAYPELSPGDSIKLNYSNRVAYIATIAGGTGVTAVSGSATTFAANSGGTIVLTMISATAWTFEIV